MLTTREVIKTFYNALIQRLKKHRGDWNQNDPSADDYIKNRPFYTDETKKVVKLDKKYLPDIIATKSEVETAKTTANDAKTAADNAQTTANDAKTAADNAQTTANDAKTAAKTAKTTANDAQSAVITAKTTANTAKTTANTAKTTADAAKITAEAAKTTANDAKTAADNANAKVAKALTVERSGNISAPNDTMDSGTYQRLNLYSKDLIHSASFAVTESIGLKIFVDRDGGLQSNLSNPSTVEFQANGSSCMRLKGIDEFIINSSTPGSTKEFKITVDDSGTLTTTEV